MMGGVVTTPSLSRASRKKVFNCVVLVLSTRLCQSRPDHVTSQLTALNCLAEAVFRRYPFRMSRLKQSLVLLALLRRRGVEAELMIRVAKA